jgi:branched-subunit amino acid transport protein
MEVRPEILALIAACAAVAAGQRVLPIIALARAELPAWLKDWLGYVPLGIVAALLALELLAPRAAQGAIVVGPAAIAIVPAFLVAWWTRGLLGATLAGVGTYWLLTGWLGLGA